MYQSKMARLAGPTCLLAAALLVVAQAIGLFAIDPDDLGAAVNDPLSCMLATADTFRQMTRMVMELAGDLCDGRLMMAHEGGYSESYVPFCGHAVLEEMSEAGIHAADPLAENFAASQPNDRMERVYSDLITEMRDFFNVK